MLNLDHNATAPLHPAARDAMTALLGEPLGNPASAHGLGRQSRRMLEDARERIAARLGAFPDEVVFTSGATEANNLALFGLAGEPPGHLLASPIEHPCVGEPLRQLEARGFTLEWLPVDPTGIVRSIPIRDETRLVAVMLANHETGAIQPVAALALGVRGAFHCDAAQAVGKIPVRFNVLGVTSLSVSAHKFGGPPGIGALLIRRGAKLRPLLFGGHQQHGQRPGTEPTLLAVGMAAALDAVCDAMDATAARMRGLRERFLGLVRAGTEPVFVNGPDEGLPHVLNLSFPGCRAESLLMALDLAGVACSTGSACSSGSLLPSPVLSAMGVPEERLRSAMRFSLGPEQTDAEVADAAERVVKVVRRVRAVPG